MEAMYASYKMPKAQILANVMQKLPPDYISLYTTLQFSGRMSTMTIDSVSIDLMKFYTKTLLTKTSVKTSHST